MSLETRLALFKDDAIHTIATGGAYAVCEHQAGGAAELTVCLGAEATGLAVRLETVKTFDQLLRSNKRADGTVLVYEGGGWTGHIIELKTTVTAEKWRQAQQQLRDGVPRLAAVAGVLGVEVTAWRFWLAFREDRLSARTADPVGLEAPLGTRPDPDDPWATWSAPVVDGGPIAGRVPRGGVTLDHGGRGALTL